MKRHATIPTMNNPEKSMWWNGRLKRARWIGKKILQIVGGAILFLVLLEIGLHAAYALFPQQLQEDMRFSLSPYKDKSWASELYKNEVVFGNQPTLWDRYDEWVRPAVTTTYINTDSQGRRKTWNPPIAAGKSPKQIWVLGGSSAFGAGARDDYTIPSDLSRILNGNGSQYQVSNYGTYAYVFPQSVIQFVKLLETGKRPDYVIFYGGSADVDAAFDAGSAGALSAEGLWANHINSTVPSQVITGSKQLLSQYCLTCRLVVNAARKVDPSSLRVSQPIGMTYDNQQLDTLAMSTTANDVNAANFVSRLAAAYHFNYLVVWEPSPFGDRLVGDEQRLVAEDWRLTNQNNSYLYTTTTALLAKASLPNFINLSGLLKPRTTMIFLDDVHITEDGDQIVATKLANIVKLLL
jgi:hypothetical protein